MSLDEKRKKIRLKDRPFSSSIEMNDSNIVVMNPINQKSHRIGTSDVLVKYQHGNVLVKANDNISYEYNPLNNVMLPIIGKETKIEKLKS